MNRTRPLIVVAACLLIATVAHADIELYQEHTFDASPGQTVSIDASFHRIDIRVVQGNTVHAIVELSTSSSSSKAERAIEDFTPHFEEKGDTLLIRSTRKKGWSWTNARIKGRITVTMPPDLDLDIDNSSGSITIEGDMGDATVNVDASSGSINIEGAMRTLNLDTSSGSTRARVSRPLETFNADASSGSIRLSGGAETASVDTSSGSINLAGLRGDASLDASSGSITARWDYAPPGTSIDAGTSSGSVTIELPSGTGVTGSASTSSGGIHSDFPASISKSRATFTGDSHGVDLRLSASSGSVKVLED